MKLVIWILTLALKLAGCALTVQHVLKVLAQHMDCNQTGRRPTVS